MTAVASDVAYEDLLAHDPLAKALEVAAALLGPTLADESGAARREQEPAEVVALVPRGRRAGRRHQHEGYDRALEAVLHQRLTAF